MLILSCAGVPDLVVEAEFCGRLFPALEPQQCRSICLEAHTGIVQHAAWTTDPMDTVPATRLNLLHHLGAAKGVSMVDIIAAKA